MRARIMRACGIALASTGLLIGCASDMWYKSGAGADDLAEDKAACRSEGAALQGTASIEAFEKCMSARDWWHMASPGKPAPSPRRTRKLTTPVAALAPTATVAPRVAASPDVVSTPSREPIPASSPALASAPSAEARVVDAPIEGATVAEPAPTPTPVSDELATPPVDAGLAEEEEIEVEEAALEPEPIDPKARQFWFKLGAGTDRLKSDQRQCRRALGVAEDASEPSRWGQSENFDACMREKGWGGGALR